MGVRATAALDSVLVATVLTILVFGRDADAMQEEADDRHPLALAAE
ncbi:hypothetical protein [Rhizobium leguminosarum]|nr:hypothetical protein [Rhizobium leguminosarum]